MNHQSSPGDHEEAPQDARRIVLCLSGGGYRAMLFHLGALRRLFEVGLLRHVTDVSSVSGGSILAGRLAATVACWTSTSEQADLTAWDKEIADPIRRFAQRNIRTPAMLLAPVNRGAVRGLARAYRDINDKRLDELPPFPRFQFCATDTVFGSRWTFERTRMGSPHAGHWTVGHLTVADAMAASSCFPPVFSPMRIPLDLDGVQPIAASERARAWVKGDHMLLPFDLYRPIERNPEDPAAYFPRARRIGPLRATVEDDVYRRTRAMMAGTDFIDNRNAIEAEINRQLLRRLRLADGGVFDNLGVGDSDLGELNAERTILLVSDGGGTFDFRPDGAGVLAWFKRLPRYSAITATQVRRRRLQVFIHQSKRGEATRLYWGIHHPFSGPGRSRGFKKDLVESRIADIRTDLDRFSMDEITILENHGYSLADQELWQKGQLVRSWMRQTKPKFRMPHPPPGASNAFQEFFDSDAAAAILSRERSAKRTWRGRGWPCLPQRRSG